MDIYGSLDADLHPTIIGIIGVCQADGTSKQRLSQGILGIKLAKSAQGVESVIWLVVASLQGYPGASGYMIQPTSVAHVVGAAVDHQAGRLQIIDQPVAVAGQADQPAWLDGVDEGL